MDSTSSVQPKPDVTSGPDAKYAPKSEQESITPALVASERDNIDREAAHYFAFASAAWLVTLSLPLTLFPRFLALVLGPPLTADDQNGEKLRQLNGLETLLANITGLTFIAYAAILVVQTGAIPLTSSLAGSSSINTPKGVPQAPFRTPTVLFTTILFGSIGYKSYTNGLQAFAFLNGFFVAFGLWTFLFSGQKVLTKAGADKLTSSFPFKNQFAEEKKSK